MPEGIGATESIGLILAGGQSSRMGTDKALLNWQGKPMYQAMAEVLQQAGVDRVLISSGRLAVDNSVADIIPGKGPLSGIHGVLGQCKAGSRLLVTPVDMPLLPPQACRQLLFGEGDKPTCFDGFTLPMLLPVNEDLIRQVERSINSENPGDYSLWRLHRALNGNTVSLPQELTDFFLNTNTPQEWQSACALNSTKATKPAVGEQSKIAVLDM